MSKTMLFICRPWTVADGLPITPMVSIFRGALKPKVKSKEARKP